MTKETAIKRAKKLKKEMGGFSIGDVVLAKDKWNPEGSFGVICEFSPTSGFAIDGVGAWFSPSQLTKVEESNG